MPQGVLHILFPLLIMSWIRDFYLKRKDRKKFPLHYVLIAGITGALPDADILVYMFLSFLGFSWEAVHRTWTHSLLFVVFFLLLTLLFTIVKAPSIGRHKLKWNMIFLMITFGTFTHLVLDFLIAGHIMPFYPLSSYEAGLSIIQYLPQPIKNVIIPLADGLLFLIWLIYLEVKHKISDFI